MRHLLLETADWRRDCIRYGVAAAVVLAVLIGSGVALRHTGTPSQDASEVDEAVLVDLPPAASAAPASAAAPATPASPIQRPPDRPLEPARPISAAPPAPTMPDPAAVLTPPRETATPPTATTPATPPQDERAPDGADTAVADAEIGEAGRPHASARAITAWQRSLLKRLETAKRALVAAASGVGTTEIAFEIDGAGALVSERIATSSGSPRLDATAAALVRLAAPFPAPPKGAGPDDLSFKIPVRFRH